MDAKHTQLIENVVSELTEVYIQHLGLAQNDLDFYATVTAMLVFKHLAMAEVLESVERDSSENPEDIRTLLEAKAAEIAISIRNKVFSKSFN